MTQPYTVFCKNLHTAPVACTAIRSNVTYLQRIQHLAKFSCCSWLQMLEGCAGLKNVCQPTLLKVSWMELKHFWRNVNFLGRQTLKRIVSLRFPILLRPLKSCFWDAQNSQNTCKNTLSSDLYLQTKTTGLQYICVQICLITYDFQRCLFIHAP